jgi:hypothetical protein
MILCDGVAPCSKESDVGSLRRRRKAEFDSRPKRSRRGSAAKSGRREELGTPWAKMMNEQHAESASSRRRRRQTKSGCSGDDDNNCGHDTELQI